MVEKVIEFDCDGGESDDKENCAIRTKPEQINKIISFLKENNEGHGIEKATFAVMWECLGEELNKLGPPKRTVKKWKRVWSVYKYNNKTRMPEILDKEKQTNDENSMEFNIELLAQNSHDTQTSETEHRPIEVLSSIVHKDGQNLAQNWMVLSENSMLPSVLYQGDRMCTPKLCGNSTYSTIDSVAENLHETHTQTQMSCTDCQSIELLQPVLYQVDQERVQNWMVVPGKSMEINTELLAQNSHDTQTSATGEQSIDILSQIFQQQKIIIEKLDKHENLLNEIVKKN